MEIDPKEVVDAARSAVETPELRSARLNAVVAVTVAILATFMGICKVKDDNIVFGMIMGLAGLAGWQLHPEILVKFLS